MPDAQLPFFTYVVQEPSLGMVLPMVGLPTVSSVKFGAIGLRSNRLYGDEETAQSVKPLLLTLRM